MDARRLAERIRAACLRAAQEGYEDAAFRGMCAEGALEYALDAIRRLDLEALLARASDEPPGADPPAGSRQTV